MLVTENMATAISKPTSHPPKMKRPPPPFVQTGVNGVKPQQSFSSPPSSAKRLPGANQPAATGPTSGVVTNGVNGAADSNNVKPSLQRPKKEAQKPGDQGTRSTKPLARTVSTENERRLGKKCPEPYVKTTSYILKKYAKSPPSLILHLHPTHFRFEQQDGSFPYNSEMKVIIEHIRAGTVPHDMIEELLRANVRFYEGCLIVRVVDHKSVSVQARKSSAPSTNDSNTPFSIHNYNEHVTPSAYVPYPKQNQLTADKPVPKETGSSQSDVKPDGEQSNDSQRHAKEPEPSAAQQKQTPPKPRVFTTVLHPTPRSLQAELTLLATTPDPKAARQGAANSTSRNQSSTQPPSPGSSSNQPECGHAAKRQKMLVEPTALPECEAKLTRALAPPLFLDPVDSLEAVQDLLKYMESPLHNDPPPSPKRRKRTVAELAADEALAAEEERFMLIMDERLEPNTSGGAGGPKSAVVDDTSGGAPFEPRFSRFKTLENIRLQHEEKAKREHEARLRQEMAKRQQQEQERERRRALEQRQAEEQAREESRRQHLAAQQQVQAQLAAQQQQNRHAMAQTNGVTQGPQSSPVVRNQTPHSTSSPLVGSTMGAQGGVPMSMTPSMQGAGSPPRPPSALQHAHPNVMGHPMAPSRSQQGQSRHGTPQMTPGMSQTTPTVRHATPTQRLSHASPGRSTMAPTPVITQAMIGTPQMTNGMGMTPQQQQMLLQRQMLAQQQGHLGQGQLTPQQIAQIQAQQNIQSHQQQMLQAQQQNHQQQSQQRTNNPQAYQQQLMRAQFLQMQQQQQQHSQAQGQQNQMHQGSPQMNAQQQMLMAAAQANGGQLPQNFQGMNAAQGAMAQRYNQLYQQRLLRLRQEMASRLMGQYGPPNQYPPNIAAQYQNGLERNAKAWVHEIFRRERDAAQQQRANQVAAMQAQVMQQQQQQNMMQNGMGNN
ncbi:Spt20 family-domain-containing protein [Aspergillus avenaceus]|uniref:Spt20 family-domain-containing protein n=1 Tax=Aspergillus avenaceus TaxID=36643 RepID=A0A5N6TFS9_ASPAV|nr:Spt20 family-domain-containing protein [Aspergillus avenaceus]